MGTENNGSQNPLVTLSNALSMVFDGIGIAEKGLLRNPSKEEARELNQTLLHLELERAKIQAMLNALISKEKKFAGPTAEQVAEMSTLTAEVAALTNANLTASGAVGLTSKILTLATNVATP